MVIPITNNADQCHGQVGRLVGAVALTGAGTPVGAGAGASRGTCRYGAVESSVGVCERECVGMGREVFHN